MPCNAALHLKQSKECKRQYGMIIKYDVHNSEHDEKISVIEEDEESTEEEVNSALEIEQDLAPQYDELG